LGWHNLSHLVLRQLCALLAATAGASGGEGANELATQALKLLPSNTALALHLLTALAEEAEGLDRVRRLALVNVLGSRSRELLGALGSLLAAAAQQLSQGHRGEPSWVLRSRVLGTGRVERHSSRDAWPA
jgi:hypothetical protein